MKNSQIRDLTFEELNARLTEETVNQTKMILSHAVNPIDSPAKIREQRKLIARLKTDIKRRQLEESGKIK